jgi:hypothetical protein
MSTSSLSYFSNAFPGENQLFEGNIYRLDSAPKYAIGQRYARSDGNVYRYAKFEETGYAAGLLCGPDVSAQFHADSDNGLLGTTVTNTTSGQIGSRIVEALGTSWTKNMYAGGYLIVTDGAGEGYSYRIKGNTAGGTGATATYSRIDLYDPLQVALTAASDIAIIGSLYNNVKSCNMTVGIDSIPSGVAVSTTTSTYMWAFLQTWGVCSVLMGGSITGSNPIVVHIGDQICLAGSLGYAGGGTSGACTFWPPQFGSAYVSGSTPGSSAFEGVFPIGYALDIGDASEHQSIYLKLAP